MHRNHVFYLWHKSPSLSSACASNSSPKNKSKRVNLASTRYRHLPIKIGSQWPAISAISNILPKMSGHLRHYQIVWILSVWSICRTTGKFLIKKLRGKDWSCLFMIEFEPSDASCMFRGNFSRRCRWNWLKLSYFWRLWSASLWRLQGSSIF